MEVLLEVLDVREWILVNNKFHLSGKYEKRNNRFPPTRK
ncbi:hypothetical protein SAMN05878281_1906 [Salegentibacter salegens]|uniref:Uncharacterized protein n=1 Tax=Salegentibacter salegens TaxID=143223 RepID=A0A1M7LGG2_9FLAO|nr:hypothetical protein SAMN05878281_1906 [Salegentibacter salegens]